jgi:hypothetical protein
VSRARQRFTGRHLCRCAVDPWAQHTGVGVQCLAMSKRRRKNPRFPSKDGMCAALKAWATHFPATVLENGGSMKTFSTVPSFRKMIVA